MNSWTPSVDTPARMEKTIKHGAATIVISRPVLSVEDRANRESKARTALEGVMREYLNRRRTS